jgi:hypothetical protein
LQAATDAIERRREHPRENTSPGRPDRPHRREHIAPAQHCVDESGRERGLDRHAPAPNAEAHGQRDTVIVAVGIDPLE